MEYDGFPPAGRPILYLQPLHPAARFRHKKARIYVLPHCQVLFQQSGVGTFVWVVERVAHGKIVTVAVFVAASVFVVVGVVSSVAFEGAAVVALVPPPTFARSKVTIARIFVPVVAGPVRRDNVGFLPSRSLAAAHWAHTVTAIAGISSLLPWLLAKATAMGDRHRRQNTLSSLSRPPWRP